MSHFCSEDKLPEGVVHGGNVQKGSVLTFTRAPGGRITAAADGKELAAVASPAFAAAVFDLYVGDQPVSADARWEAQRCLFITPKPHLSRWAP